MGCLSTFTKINTSNLLTVCLSDHKVFDLSSFLIHSQRMENSIKNSTFRMIPQEIMLEIFRYLDTMDHINFGIAYTDCDPLSDKKQSRNIKLCKSYQLEHTRELTKRIHLDSVVTLNISGVYWVHAVDFRKIICKLVNLEDLYAIMTTLTLADADVVAYSNTKLKKLAITIRSNNVSPLIDALVYLRTLYIDIIACVGLCQLVDSLTKHGAICKLWIDQECIMPTATPGSSLGGDIVYKEVTVFGLSKLTGALNQISGVYHLRKVYNILAKRDDNWEIVKRAKVSQPFNLLNEQQLLAEELEDDYSFNRLNFYHDDDMCSPNLHEACKNILKTKHSKKVKHLCIMQCLFANFGDVVEYHKLFKRQRISTRFSMFDLRVTDMFRNMPDIEELLIFNNSAVLYQSVSQDAYFLIANMSKLTRLTVSLSNTISGSFLVKVTENCKCLQSLNITAKHEHARLNDYLIKALPHATALKDLRLKNTRIPIDKLFATILQMQPRTIERIALICQETGPFSEAHLTLFLRLNTQLIFLYIVISCRKRDLYNIRQILALYEKKRKAARFVIFRKEINGREPSIPDVHYNEMVLIQHNVEIDPLQDLKDF